MRIGCVGFTRTGLSLARLVAASLAAEGDRVEVFGPSRFACQEGVSPYGDLHAWTAGQFARSDALLFVGACGIAVRCVGPLAADKLEDPAVVCVDEGAGFVVPLLSGHVGGANRLARRVAAACGAQAVVTTATDVRGVFAVDEWAARNDMAILDREEARRVSALLLEGSPVGFCAEAGLVGQAPAGLMPDGGTACQTGVSVSLDPARRPFAHTLRLVPRVVTVGVGCRRGTPADLVDGLVRSCLAEARVAPEAVRALATIDVKAHEPGILECARRRGWELRLLGADELARVPGDFSSSEFVMRAVGVGNVCERAACAGGGSLILPKRVADGVTVALAVAPPVADMPPAPAPAEADAPVGAPAPARVVACVGLGPGAGGDLTLRAVEALARAQTIVGYTTYVELVRGAFPQAEFVSTPMRGEEGRCRAALELAAAGRRVALVCSGDAGVYGMAGLLIGLAEEYPGVEVEVVPGVTAATGGAALLGAPLMNDWCCVSLSDLMIPWETIERRLRAAAETGMCLCLYNPGSHGRAGHLGRACDVLMEHLGPETVCGVARRVGRDGETSELTTLGELRGVTADMLSCVFVGNAQTRVVGGRMVTPRGYSCEVG